jgi:phospholipase C
MAPGSPIQHVVIIVKENHTFDNYFGRFPNAEGDATLDPCPVPADILPPHDHQAWLARANLAVRQQYTAQDISPYFAYAEQFTLCDHYFSEVTGPSTPNHLMLLAANSPIIDDLHLWDDIELQPPFIMQSLPDRLESAGLKWRNYGGYAFNLIEDLREEQSNNKSEQFVLDAAAGTLPEVSWVYAPAGLSEHAPDPVDKGVAWTVTQVNAVANSPLWTSTAIFIVWADGVGWYDHVEPANVEQWSDGTQFRFGPRVGCLVISPYAKSGYISKATHSHVSLLKFCETTFGLQPLNARDRDADDMSDCFDFTREPALPPPLSPVSKKLNGGTMTQTLAILQTSEQKKQNAIDAFNGLNPQERKDAAQQLQQQGILSPPGKQTNDYIWIIIVVGFAIVLVGGAAALTVAVFYKGDGTLSGDLLLTIFTTSAAFLAGLLAPSPSQPKPPQ